MGVRSARAVAVVVLAGLLLAGCGGSLSANDDAQNSQSRRDAVGRLNSQPSLEETEQHLHDVVQWIIDAIHVVSPGLRWVPHRERLQSPCGGEYSNTGGIEVTLPSMLSDIPIPDADWPRAVQAARNVAREAGITEIEVFRDQPGDHDVNLTGSNGNSIHFGSAEATGLRGTTGCRLPAAQKNPAG